MKAEKNNSKTKNNTYYNGYVYFIKSGNNGPIKIGYTENIEKRLSSLQTSSPYQLSIINKIKGDREKERYFHELFSSKNTNGEWFNLDDQDIEMIKLLKSD